VDNDITGNSRGISLWESSFNCVFGNNFVNNSIQVRDSGADYPDWHISMNSWDDGSKGNFWSDYSGSDVYGDCIGDVPYVVYEGNQDNYPLMAPVVREPIAPLHVSVFNPINSTYNDTSVHLVFAVDKQVEWVGYSLDRQENVTAAGNVTLAGLSDGVHTLTVYANDTFGFTGASETIVFTVATFPTNLVAAIIVVTTAVVAIGLLFYFKKRKH
jgi:parallel beta-helix repeat protein